MTKYLQHLLPTSPDADGMDGDADDWAEYAAAVDVIVAVFPPLAEEGTARSKSARLKASARRKRGDVRPALPTEPGPPEGDPSKDPRPDDKERP